MIIKYLTRTYRVPVYLRQLLIAFVTCAAIVADQAPDSPVETPIVFEQTKTFRVSGR